MMIIQISTFIIIDHIDNNSNTDHSKTNHIDATATASNTNTTTNNNNNQQQLVL